MNKVYTINEHHEAVDVLYSLGDTKLTVLHFDFHLDIAYVCSKICENTHKQIRNGKSITDICERIWYENKKDSGFHCGNFLYLPLFKKQIAHFVWIMPDDKRGNTQVLWNVLQEVGCISEEEVLSLNVNDGLISGTIFNSMFTAVSFEKFKALQNSFFLDNNDVVVDIDVDILFDARNKFPIYKVETFCNAIAYSCKRSRAIIICNSIRSGHTPICCDFYQDYIVTCIRGGNTNPLRKAEADLHSYIINNSVKNAAELEVDSTHKALLIINSLIKVDGNERNKIISEIENPYINALLLFGTKDAGPYFDKAFEMGYRDNRFIENYCYYMILQKQYDRANQLLALMLNDTWRTLKYKGMIAYHKGELDISVDCLRESLKQNQINNEANYYLARSYREKQYINDYNKVYFKLKEMNEVFK